MSGARGKHLDREIDAWTDQSEGEGDPNLAAWKTRHPLGQADFTRAEYGAWLRAVLDIARITREEAEKYVTLDQIGRFYQAGEKAWFAAEMAAELVNEGLQADGVQSQFSAHQRMIAQRADREAAALRGILRSAREGTDQPPPQPRRARRSRRAR